jgi:FkbM family methyltransferase
MLLNFKELVKKYNIHSKGVIVVGAHFGEEHNDYVSAGIQKMIYIEPCAKAFEELKRRFQYAPHVKLFNVACGDKNEVGVKMYTGDNTINKGQSNSLLKPDLHLTIHPGVEFPDIEEVAVEVLDDMDLQPHMTAFEYTLLVLDCQGFENRILMGAERTLAHIDYVYTEINRREVYEGNAMVEEIDELLNEFTRVETGTWVGDAWTDALYVRKTLL